jgi:hypothetical protein
MLATEPIDSLNKGILDSMISAHHSPSQELARRKTEPSTRWLTHKYARLLVPLTLFIFFTMPVFAQMDRTSPVSDIRFANSGSVAAQPAFLHGLAQLHNFEYEAAAEDFRNAQQLDPNFAMAYWGEAMTYNHPVWFEQKKAAA